MLDAPREMLDPDRLIYARQQAGELGVRAAGYGSGRHHRLFPQLRTLGGGTGFLAKRQVVLPPDAAGGNKAMT